LKLTKGLVETNWLGQKRKGGFIKGMLKGWEYCTKILSLFPKGG